MNNTPNTIRIWNGRSYLAMNIVEAWKALRAAFEPPDTIESLLADLAIDHNELNKSSNKFAIILKLLKPLSKVVASTRRAFEIDDSVDDFGVFEILQDVVKTITKYTEERRN